MILVCRDEISPRPAGIDPPMWKINFVPARRDSFAPSICGMQFPCIFLCNMSVYEIENP